MQPRLAVRRRAGALLLAVGLLLPVGAAPAPAVPAGPADARAARSTTTVTVLAPHCGGCRLAAHSVLASNPYEDWTQTRTVRNGVATFRVPTGHTRGLSLVLGTPWEGLQGYATKVAMRYAGAETGDPVAFARARTQREATACWAGTSEARATLALGVRQVRVQGVVGEVSGTIAWVRRTPEWLPPMQGAPQGVLGSQSPDYSCEG